MLKFMRNKIIGIEKIRPDEVLVHGILDDDIYSLEVKVRINLSDLRVISIDGKWKRWTTPECPRAEIFLKDAVGICLKEKDVYEKVRREIGKRSCRHFANLLIECFDSLLSAKEKLSEQTRLQRKEEVEIDIRDVFQECPRENFLIDLHVHTYPASSCARNSVEQQIEEAKKIGLNGICLTDHNFIWERESVERLKEKHDFLILRGTEVTTDQGDILVFGIEKRFSGIVSIKELKDEVEKSDGFMISAHPFRGFIISDFESIGLTPERAAKRDLFRYVDAIESLNGRVNDSENIFTHRVAEILHLPETGGSDAHETSEIGIYATCFEEKIEDERDLIDALKNRRYRPCIFRGRR